MGTLKEFTREGLDKIVLEKVASSRVSGRITSLDKVGAYYRICPLSDKSIYLVSGPRVLSNDIINIWGVINTFINYKQGIDCPYIVTDLPYSGVKRLAKFIYKHFKSIKIDVSKFSINSFSLKAYCS